MAMWRSTFPPFQSRRAWPCLLSALRPSWLRAGRSARAPEALGEVALHRDPSGLAEALVMVERGLREAVGREEAAVVVEGQPHSQPETPEALTPGLALGLAHERARDAAPAVIGMHREAADVEAGILPGPEHGAHHDAPIVDDRAAALLEMREDCGRRFLQGAGRWVGWSRLRGECEADQLRDGRGIGRGGGPDGPARRHATPRSMRRPAW